jgi:hypothetical protein
MSTPSCTTTGTQPCRRYVVTPPLQPSPGSVFGVSIWVSIWVSIGVIGCLSTGTGGRLLRLVVVRRKDSFNTHPGRRRRTSRWRRGRRSPKRDPRRRILRPACPSAWS